MFGIKISHPPHPVMLEFKAPNVEAPESILDDFVARQQQERAKHASEMKRLSEIIADATTRLMFHTTAYDAIDKMLRPIETATDATLDEDFHVIQQTDTPT